MTRFRCCPSHAATSASDQTPFIRHIPDGRFSRVKNRTPAPAGLQLSGDFERLRRFVEARAADRSYPSQTSVRGGPLGAPLPPCTANADQSRSCRASCRRWFWPQLIDQPQDRIVERTFGWLNRCRRLARDVEHRARSHLAFVQIAMIRIMMRRLARTSTS
jgi:transposase